MRGTGCQAARQAFLEGMYALISDSRDTLEECRRCFADALQLDPAFARAWSALSYVYVQAALHGWQLEGGDLASAGALARRGVELAPDDHFTRWHLAFYLLNTQQPELARQEYETALRLSEDSEDLLVEVAEALICAGQLEDGIALIERACRSRDWERRDGVVLNSLAARHQPGAYEEAVAALARMHRRPGDPRGVIDLQLLSAALDWPHATVPFCRPHGPPPRAQREADGHSVNGSPVDGGPINGSPVNGNGAVLHKPAPRATDPVARPAAAELRRRTRRPDAGAPKARAIPAE